MIGVGEGFPCEGATQLLAELREAVQCFLLRMAAVFPQRTQQLVFLINNYDLVLGVLMVSLHSNNWGASNVASLRGFCLHLNFFHDCCIQ